MVTIWTLYDHIVTTPAGIFTIRAGLFFTVGRHDRSRSCRFEGDYFTVTMCVTHFQQRVILSRNPLKILKVVSLINEQKKVAFQLC